MKRRTFLTVIPGLLGWASFSQPTNQFDISSHSGRQRFAQDDLTRAAIQAARRAGASYAEVHMQETRQETRFVYRDRMGTALREGASVTVRALVNDCWGIAGNDGVVPSADMMTKLGYDAAAQARATSSTSSPPIGLASTPSIPNRNWVMPVQFDPFQISAEEKFDVLSAMCDTLSRLRFRIDNEAIEATFLKEARAIATSDGIRCSQTLFNTSARVAMQILTKSWAPEMFVDAWTGDFLTPAGQGWEYLLNAPVREQAQHWIDLALRSDRLFPVDVGRYDVVLDAYATASLLDATLGVATELDRALGVQANYANTSFIADPLQMLGSLQVASPSITVTSNRSQLYGAATVPWDDEGVVPAEATLIQDGILTDMQTTREGAMELAPAYQRLGRPVRSNGCAGRVTATHFPGQRPPNLVLSPGREDLEFSDLVRNVKRGYAILGSRVETDWQALNGVGRPMRMFAIRNGKLAEAMEVRGVEYLFRTPEFWKSVVAMGGSRSQRSFGIVRDPRAMVTAHTVSAVPIQVSQLRFANWQRS